MYYVISTQILQDNTTAQSIMPYEKKEEAISAFHSIMASNYVSPTIKTCACVVQNEIGGRIKDDYIQDAPVPNPEPVEE